MAVALAVSSSFGWFRNVTKSSAGIAMDQGTA
jgi:hypothetical protein